MNTMKAHLATVLVTSALLLAPAVHSQTPSSTDIIGLWLEPKGEGGIELKPCGQGICGHIVWLKAPVDGSGKPLRDANNPDPAKRSTPICNLQMIGGGTRRPDGSLEKGWIYNPEDGGKYDVDIQRVDASRLRVHGYLGIKFLGETFVWRKAPDNLGRCKTA